MEEMLRPASVTPAAGVVGAGGQKLDITKKTNLLQCLNIMNIK